MTTNHEIFAFGEFRLDVKERRVWRGQSLIPLPPKTFDLLVVMVQDAGRLLDKEYLIRSVWPDSYVQDANLSVHIANIRKALGSTDEPVPLIETVPKSGYRFTALVCRVPTPEETIPNIAQLAAAASSSITRLSAQQNARAPRHWLAAMVTIFLVFTLAVVYVRAKDNHDHQPTQPSTTHPLTSTPGLFLQPAFSPDGLELAYTWQSDARPHRSIYLQRVSEDSRRLLVDTGSDDYAPIWSPDGKQIAFLHTAAAPQTFEIRIIDSKDSKNEQTVATVCDASDTFHGLPSLSWSPDGQALLTTDCVNGNPELTAISVKSGARRRLTSAPAYSVDDQAMYSPSGSWIAFRRSQGDSSDDIYIIPSSGGPLKKLTELSRPIDGLAWSADGKRIIFSSAQATSQGSIWSLPVSGGAPVAVTTPLTHTSSPAISPTGNRMAYVDSPNNVSIWKLSLTGREESQSLIVSNFFDSSAVYSPDDSQVAFRSDRSGANEIWLSHSDGSEPKRLTHFNGPMTGSPRWSPDGRTLAFDSRVRNHAQIFLADLTSDQITRLTNVSGDGVDNVVPHWSVDGKSVYFSSDRTGRWQVWRHDIATGTETQVTIRGGFNGAESTDGKYLFYVGDLDATQIRRQLLSDPQNDVPIVSIGTGLWHSWTLTQNSLLYLKRSPHSASADLVRLDIHSRKQQTIASVTQAANDSLSISSDQRSLLYARRSNTGSSIMIVDGWR